MSDDRRHVGEGEPAPPAWEEPHLPPEAERMGLLPVTAPELAFASALRADKRLHKVIAWVGLVIMLATILGGLVFSVVGLAWVFGH